MALEPRTKASWTHPEEWGLGEGLRLGGDLRLSSPTVPAAAAAFVVVFSFPLHKQVINALQKGTDTPPLQPASPGQIPRP